VRYVPSGENRSHGSALGAKLRAFCTGRRSVVTCFDSQWRGRARSARIEQTLRQALRELLAAMEHAAAWASISAVVSGNARIGAGRLLAHLAAPVGAR
jgi:hypothetical protein